MTALFYAGLICVWLLVMVAIAAACRFLETRSPRFSKLLDDWLPEGETWKRW